MVPPSIEMDGGETNKTPLLETDGASAVEALALSAAAVLRSGGISAVAAYARRRR
jgi:hypothetical protein